MEVLPESPVSSPGRDVASPGLDDQELTAAAELRITLEPIGIPLPPAGTTSEVMLGTAVRTVPPGASPR